MSKPPITLDRATQLPHNILIKPGAQVSLSSLEFLLSDVWSHKKKSNSSFPVLPSDPAPGDSCLNLLGRSDKHKLPFGTLMKVKLPSVSIFWFNKAKRKNIQSTEQSGKC